jgi:hypothetical protein
LDAPKFDTKTGSYLDQPQPNLRVAKYMMPTPQKIKNVTANQLNKKKINLTELTADQSDY